MALGSGKTEGRIECLLQGTVGEKVKKMVRFVGEQGKGAEKEGGLRY